MAILDNVMGGGDQQHSSTDLGTVFGTDPQFGLQASDILHSENSDSGSGGGDSSSFTGIGDLGIGFAAPTMAGAEVSNDQHSSGNDGGGLLGGLL